jgi:hypothetical protein
MGGGFALVTGNVTDLRCSCSTPVIAGGWCNFAGNFVENKATIQQKSPAKAGPINQTPPSFVIQNRLNLRHFRCISVVISLLVSFF